MGHGDYERLTPEAIDRVWVRLRVRSNAKPAHSADQAQQLGDAVPGFRW